MQIVRSFTVDLTKIRGRGDFKCPRCGVEISPDDETEETYTVLEAIMKGEKLEEIALQCSKCQTQIYLTGFHLLDRIR